jgi:hypothetical protein
MHDRQTMRKSYTLSILKHLLFRALCHVERCDIRPLESFSALSRNTSHVEKTDYPQVWRVREKRTSIKASVHLSTNCTSSLWKRTRSCCYHHVLLPTNTRITYVLVIARTEDEAEFASRARAEITLMITSARFLGKDGFSTRTALTKAR